MGKKRVVACNLQLLVGVDLGRKEKKRRGLAGSPRKANNKASVHHDSALSSNVYSLDPDNHHKSVVSLSPQPFISHTATHTHYGFLFSPATSIHHHHHHHHISPRHLSNVHSYVHIHTYLHTHSWWAHTGYEKQIRMLSRTLHFAAAAAGAGGRTGAGRSLLLAIAGYHKTSTGLVGLKANPNAREDLIAQQKALLEKIKVSE